MKRLLALFLCLSFFCACHKDEAVSPAPVKDTLYPKVVHFSGTLHTVHIYGDYFPQHIFDTTYQAVFEIVYPDSNWIALNFSYIDAQDSNGKYTPFQATESISRVLRTDNRYTFDSSRNHLAHFTIQGDSLKVDKSITVTFNILLYINFAGRKI